MPLRQFYLLSEVLYKSSLILDPVTQFCHKGYYEDEFTPLFIHSFAKFHHLFLCELRGPAWAVGIMNEWMNNGVLPVFLSAFNYFILSFFLLTMRRRPSPRAR